MASSDRTAEIWSTRLQRELLALTSVEDDKDHIETLPDFIKVTNHELDIAKAVCTVSFEIEVEYEEKEEGETEESAEKEGEAELKKDHVSVTLDASLPTKADGTVDASPSSYPFQKPTAVLKSGAHLFPDGSTVSDGDFVEIDCDWTPSLHLNDAILNVALKMRESIRRGEPYSKAAPPKTSTSGAASSFVADNVLPNTKKLSAFFSSLKSPSGFSMASITDDSGAATGPSPSAAAGAARSLKGPSRTSIIASSKPKPTPDNLKIGDVIDLSDDPWNRCAGMYSCKAIRRPAFMEKAMGEAATSQKPKPGEFPGEDENEVPSGSGNYMKLQSGGIAKVASSGFAGAKSMFGSFTQSAKSVLEESFLMITDELIIELRSNKLNIGSGTVTFSLPIAMLAKLKFRRQESLSLFFKEAPDDPLIFMCPQSASAVQEIQAVLKRHGVKGKHTNAATQRAIQMALALVAEIQTKEKSLVNGPTVEKVDEIMDLYRQAAEKFEVAGDPRHEEVMSHMHKFLAKPLVMSILDGSYGIINKKKAGSTNVPEGEVLETARYDDDDHDDEDGGAARSNAETPKTKFKGSVEAAIDHADAILEEAKQDLMNMDTDLEQMLSSEEPSTPEPKSDDRDAVAELDAMLSAADKELEDIMAS
uniref:Uncharacterized protein n=1 Tax=Helicotheca tamesis TaxID=374047 RepID=A0A7S2DZK0_9STRA|mmetsp:Transcript_11178/g.15495  ORF Transcript_11178/g.15495 Transcript_11178/m.15495 type:complete len:647 (+) Transcript_11178:157-2097(+)|eukprot:CAMPEP_0185734686 /NCGR_PEP_ID=MMETSP1171-20130828/23170_1 /TAXON_ID=374046 /ORGANISM="Helicotheca tamensis, Strain CCMP826" /LENGTH=646 /DNA_ID=CAMNT_0028404747 /DNA_START=146 /DNA_END=2086 /DNA_ORIENTATION=-